MIILGIDPGSRVTGFGLVRQSGQQIQYVSSGCIRLGEGDLEVRLEKIFLGISELIDTYKPDEFAIEQVFMGKNADSAIKLGQARGTAIVAAKLKGLSLNEYAPRAIKQAVVGKGSATKEQVQHMVQYLLKLPGKPQADAADALAIAICHAHTRAGLAAAYGVTGVVRGRMQALKTIAKA